MSWACTATRASPACTKARSVSCVKLPWPALVGRESHLHRRRRAAMPPTARRRCSSNIEFARTHAVVRAFMTRAICSFALGNPNQARQRGPRCHRLVLRAAAARSLSLSWMPSRARSCLKKRGPRRLTRVVVLLLGFVCTKSTQSSKRRTFVLRPCTLDDTLHLCFLPRLRAPVKYPHKTKERKVLSPRVGRIGQRCRKRYAFH